MLELVGGAIPPAPKVPASTRNSARLKRVTREPITCRPHNILGCANMCEHVRTCEGEHVVLPVQAAVGAQATTIIQAIEARPHFEPVASRIQRVDRCVCVKAGSYKNN